MSMPLLLLGFPFADLCAGDDIRESRISSWQAADHRVRCESGDEIRGTGLRTLGARSAIYVSHVYHVVATSHWLALTSEVDGGRRHNPGRSRASCSSGCT